MFRREKRVLLRHYLDQGVPKAEIAHSVGVSRRTVYHWIETGQLDRELDAEPVRYGPRRRAPSKLEPPGGQASVSSPLAVLAQVLEPPVAEVFRRTPGISLDTLIFRSSLLDSITLGLFPQAVVRRQPKWPKLQPTNRQGHPLKNRLPRRP